MKTNDRSLLAELLGLAGLAGEYRRGLIELAKMRAAVYRLRAAEALRNGLITLFEIVFCAIFFLCGLAVLHFDAYLFLSHGPHLRAWVLLGLGGLELIAAAVFAAWFLSARRWISKALPPGVSVPPKKHEEDSECG